MSEESAATSDDIKAIRKELHELSLQMNTVRVSLNGESGVNGIRGVLLETQASLNKNWDRLVQLEREVRENKNFSDSGDHAIKNEILRKIDEVKDLESTERKELVEKMSRTSRWAIGLMVPLFILILSHLFGG